MLLEGVNSYICLYVLTLYVQIVHSRLCDSIPMAIRQCLHVKFVECLNDNFMKYGMSDGVEAKVTTNKRLNEQRKSLDDKIERLQLARSELAKL